MSSRCRFVRFLTKYLFILVLWLSMCIIIVFACGKYVYDKFYKRNTAATSNLPLCNNWKRSSQVPSSIIWKKNILGISENTSLKLEPYRCRTRYYKRCWICMSWIADTIRFGKKIICYSTIQNINDIYFISWKVSMYLRYVVDTVLKQNFSRIS